MYPQRGCFSHLGDTKHYNNKSIGGRPKILQYYMGEGGDDDVDNEDEYQRGGLLYMKGSLKFNSKDCKEQIFSPCFQKQCSG